MKAKTRANLLILILLAAAALAGCGVIQNPTPAALPTVVLDSGGAAAGGGLQISTGSVTASGVVAPARQAQLAFALTGTVKTVHVAVGDDVQAGQALITLSGSEKLAAAVETANLEVLSAQQALDALDNDMDVRLAQALQAISDNQEAVRDAERYIYNLNTTTQQVDIDAAFANMIIAQDRLERAQKDYKPYENKADDNVVRAGLLSRLSQAQKDYDTLVRKYNNLRGTASDLDVSQAQADLAIAQAQLAKSQRDYESLQNGPDPDEIALAQARLATARAQLAAAQAALLDLEIHAPFNGTVTRLDIYENEWVTPGQAVLQLSDLGALRVETTDLSERDIPRVALGQAVTVFIKALGLETAGVVREISPLADTIGGDVVYKTTIELTDPPASLRAGMSVEVSFESGQ